jgi:sortase A
MKRLHCLRAREELRRAGLWFFATFGAIALLHGSWIPAKAVVAQLLLERAWTETVAGGGSARPWPWADTQPVGRLELPDHGVDLVVLAGASGRTLAFAPGHLTGSAALGAPGNAVIAGHRDTHFRFLPALVRGDEILAHGSDGRVHRYRVVTAGVVHERDASVLDPFAGAVLTLVTCYPFDTPVPGGPLRYVVVAALTGVADVTVEI